MNTSVSKLIDRGAEPHNWLFPLQQRYVILGSEGDPGSRMGNKGSGGGSSISMGITGPGGTMIGRSLFGTGVAGAPGLGCGTGILTGMHISKNANVLYILWRRFSEHLRVKQAPQR